MNTKKRHRGLSVGALVVVVVCTVHVFDRAITEMLITVGALSSMLGEIEEDARQRAERMEMLRTHLNWQEASDEGRCHPEIEELIVKSWSSSTRRFPLDVLRNLIWLESRCIPWAVSNKGAVGLGQVTPETADFLHPGSSRWLFDPEVNLHLAVDNLERMLDLGEGDLIAALTMYNWGPYRYFTGITTDEFARRVTGD